MPTKDTGNPHAAAPAAAGTPKAPNAASLVQSPLAAVPGAVAKPSLALAQKGTAALSFSPLSPTSPLAGTTTAPPTQPVPRSTAGMAGIKAAPANKAYGAIIAGMQNAKPGEAYKNLINIQAAGRAIAGNHPVSAGVSALQQARSSAIPTLRGAKKTITQAQPTYQQKQSSEAPIKTDLPPVRQDTDYTCGPTALEAVTKSEGKPHSEEQLARLAHADKETGTPPDDLTTAAWKTGLPAHEEEYMSVEELKQKLDAKLPVICDIQAYGTKDEYEHRESGHYVTAVGYDAHHVYFRDPSIGSKVGKLPITEFKARWKDQEDETRGGRKTDHLGIVIDKPNSSPDKALPQTEKIAYPALQKAAFDGMTGLILGGLGGGAFGAFTAEPAKKGQKITWADRLAQALPLAAVGGGVGYMLGAAGGPTYDPANSARQKLRENYPVEKHTLRQDVQDYYKDAPELVKNDQRSALPSLFGVHLPETKVANYSFEQQAHPSVIDQYPALRDTSMGDATEVFPASPNAQPLRKDQEEEDAGARTLGQPSQFPAHMSGPTMGKTGEDARMMQAIENYLREQRKEQAYPDLRDEPEGAHSRDEGAHNVDDGAHKMDDGAHKVDDGAHKMALDAHSDSIAITPAKARTHCADPGCVLPRKKVIGLLSSRAIKRADAFNAQLQPVAQQQFTSPQQAGAQAPPNTQNGPQMPANIFGSSLFDGFRGLASTVLGPGSPGSVAPVTERTGTMPPKVAELYPELIDPVSSQDENVKEAAEWSAHTPSWGERISKFFHQGSRENMNPVQGTLMRAAPMVKTNVDKEAMSRWRKPAELAKVIKRVDIRNMRGNQDAKWRRPEQVPAAVMKDWGEPAEKMMQMRSSYPPENLAAGYAKQYLSDIFHGRPELTSTPVTSLAKALKRPTEPLVYGSGAPKELRDQGKGMPGKAYRGTRNPDPAGPGEKEMHVAKHPEYASAYIGRTYKEWSPQQLQDTLFPDHAPNSSTRAGFLHELDVPKDIKWHESSKAWDEAHKQKSKGLPASGPTEHTLEALISADTPASRTWMSYHYPLAMDEEGQPWVGAPPESPAGNNGQIVDATGQMPKTRKWYESYTAPMEGLPPVDRMPKERKVVNTTLPKKPSGMWDRFKGLFKRSKYASLLDIPTDPEELERLAQEQRQQYLEMGMPEEEVDRAVSADLMPTDWKQQLNGHYPALMD